MLQETRTSKKKHCLICKMPSIAMGTSLEISFNFHGLQGDAGIGFPGDSECQNDPIGSTCRSVGAGCCK